MPVLNDHASNLLHTQLTALRLAYGSDSDVPATAGLTSLMKHGGLYTLLDPEMMNARLGALKASGTPGAGLLNTEYLMTTAQAQASYFFYHLVQDPFDIPSDLMSHIVFPHEGSTYSNRKINKASPTKLPAAFTFIGQFIDHDLTMNAMELFTNQGGAIPSGASPLIDLDSVYGPRVPPTPDSIATTPDTPVPASTPPHAIFDEQGRFVLSPIAGPQGVGIVGYDYPRDQNSQMAKIPDARNDENQLIAQIQILLMRLHNTFIDKGLVSGKDAAQQQTIYTWQSVVLSEYLPKIIGPTAATDILNVLKTRDFAALKHHPLIDSATGKYIVSMPHEFAIAFRFGHSQLRSRYELNGYSGDIPLFLNQVPNPDDLRGGRPLLANHVIDWNFFLAQQPSDRPNPETVSNRIDTKVTGAVFDLPESAIPDDIKYIGNLPHRNLIRSRQIGLASGETLAQFYGLTPLSIDQVETSVPHQGLFKDINNGGRQATPLWYYVLKEAELAAEGTYQRPMARGSSALWAAGSSGR